MPSRPQEHVASYAYNGCASPSMMMERGNPSPFASGPADYPESAWTQNARHGLNAPQFAAYESTMDYGSFGLQTGANSNFVTWDYASAFLYAKAVPLQYPYPYILVPQG